MKNGSTFILRATIILIAVIVIGICLFALPVGLLSDLTGYYQPIILGLYVTAIPFFYAIYQAFKLLDFIDTNKAFSLVSIQALKRIKYCAYIICTLFAFGMPYVFYVADADDAPGIAALGFVIVGASFVIGTFAGVAQRLFKNAVDIKAENDLTV